MMVLNSEKSSWSAQEKIKMKDIQNATGAYPLILTCITH